MGAGMRRYLILIAGVFVAVALLPAAGFGQQADRDFQNLQPGARADLDERVPVNFVFVGYDRDDVDREEFLSGLPERYKPVARSRLFYEDNSLDDALLGLNYTYDYSTFYAGDAYEQRVFDYLSTNAQPARLTEFQKLYNGNNRAFCSPPDEDPDNPVPCQREGVRNITNNNLIDAPGFERWLAENAPDGVNTERNTVFFINWWGNGKQPREGFKHHVYTKTDEADPDTGYNFGAERDSRKLIAWGGTTADDEESGLGSTRRVWFHDLSAGPDSFTDNWNVDTPDLTGDGVEDYRLPPIWEYTTRGGYRAESKLGGDLAKVSRYAALNLLFTSSPLYPPQFTPRLLPERINLDVNTVEGIPDVNASRSYQTTSLIRDEIGEVHRLPYSLDQQDLAYRGKARECYESQLPANPRRCYPDKYPNYPGSASPFLFGVENEDRLLDDESTRRQYEAALINWATTKTSATFPPLGFADDNYRDGTQSFVFSFVSPEVVDAGYGLSTTEIHEYGHHLNLSHPFDGYDYASRTDYGPDGPYYLSLIGNENNSMMSYVDLNWDFSQFDRDNTNRFQATSYITNANAIAQRILASDRAGRAADELARADELYGRTKTELRNHDYAATFDSARLAYERVLEGAGEAGVEVRASDAGRTASSGSRAAASRIPGAYVDRPEAEGQSLAKTRDPRKIETSEPDAFSPTAHRQRR